MRILVTGGTGFIGRALCAALAQDRAELTVLTRNAARARSLLPAGTTLIGSLQSLRADTQFDALINLAGEPIAAARWSTARKELLEASRIGLTHALVDWIRAAPVPPRVLVSGSAIGWYGDQGDTEVTEDTPPHDEYQHRLCRDWEQAALAAETAGVRTACLRTGLVIAPGGGFLARMLPPARVCLGGHIGSGRQWMSWVHREDLVAMIRLLLEREDLRGAFNATAPNPVRSREFAQAMARVLRRPQMPAPGALFELVFGEMSRLLLTGQRVLPARFAAAGMRWKYTGVEDALRAGIAGTVYSIDN